MIEQIILETKGFRFSFNADYKLTDFVDHEWAKNDEVYLDMVVTFQLLPPLPELTVHSEKTSISTVDFRDLIAYFEQHMAKLREANGDAVSDAFVNKELGFQLQAFEGDVEPPMDDMFSLSCQVIVGKTEEGERVYVGGECSVTFEQIQAFIRDTQAFLDELPTLHSQLTSGRPDTEDKKPS